MGSDQSANNRRHVPQDSGDIGIDDTEHWNKEYHLNDVEFDKSVCGPKNMPENLTEGSCAIGVVNVNVFLNDDLWINFVSKTNQPAEQIKAAKPNHYYTMVRRAGTIHHDTIHIATNVKRYNMHHGIL